MGPEGTPNTNDFNDLCLVEPTCPVVENQSLGESFVPLSQARSALSFQPHGRSYWCPSRRRGRPIERLPTQPARASRPSSVQFGNSRSTSGSMSGAGMEQRTTQNSVPPHCRSNLYPRHLKRRTKPPPFAQPKVARSVHKGS